MSCLMLSERNDPSGKYLYAACSRSGEIISYRIFASTGALASASKVYVRGGNNSVLLAVSPKGGLLFVSDANDNSILTLKVNAQTGRLVPGEGMSIRASARLAGLAALPSEKVLYVVQQNPDGISAYLINSTTAVLTPLGAMPFKTGRTPTSITLNSSGTVAYVGCRGEIWIHRIDASSGALSAIGTVKAQGPISLATDDSGQLLLASDALAATVNVYRIDKTSGALTPIASGPTKGRPTGIAISKAVGTAPTRPATFLVFVAGAVAPVRINVPQGTDDYFVKFERIGQPPLTVTGYIRAGEALNGELPVGTYTLKYATGPEWEGTDSLFGPNTRFYETGGELLFRMEGSKAVGHEISLIQQESGNLDVEQISLGQF